MSNINFLSKILYSLREENYKNCIKYTYSIVMNRYITGRDENGKQKARCASQRTGLVSMQRRFLRCFKEVQLFNPQNLSLTHKQRDCLNKR